MTRLEALRYAFEVVNQLACYDNTVDLEEMINGVHEDK